MGDDQFSLARRGWESERAKKERTGLGDVGADHQRGPQTDDRSEGRLLLPRVAELVPLDDTTGLNELNQSREKRNPSLGRRTLTTLTTSATNASYSDSCTYTRSMPQQLWPELNIADRG